MPMLLVMLVLVIYPIVETFSYSLKKWKLSKPGSIKFIGLKIIQLYSDPNRFYTVWEIPCIYLSQSC